MNGPILLFGASSIVGFHVASAFADSVTPFVPRTNRSASVRRWPRLALEDPRWIRSVVGRGDAKAVVYCHAVCDVAKCQADPGWAYGVNVGHVERLVSLLPPSVRLVYVSSDHVFAGDGVYTESSDPCPISVYGRTRLEAEKVVAARANTLVVRSGLAIGSSPNGRCGHLDWLRDRSRRGLPLTVVADEHRSVVWASDLAERLMELVDSRTVGLRHVTAGGAVSRVELANHLMRVVLRQQPSFRIENRHQQPVPHLGSVELDTLYRDDLARPLNGVVGPAHARSSDDRVGAHRSGRPHAGVGVG